MFNIHLKPQKKFRCGVLNISQGFFHNLILAYYNSEQGQTKKLQIIGNIEGFRRN